MLVVIAGYAFVKSVHIWPQIVSIIPTGKIGGLCVLAQLLSLAVMLVALLVKFWNSFGKLTMAIWLGASLGTTLAYLGLVFITYITTCLLLEFD